MTSEQHLVQDHLVSPTHIWKLDSFVAWKMTYSTVLADEDGKPVLTLTRPEPPLIDGCLEANHATLASGCTKLQIYQTQQGCANLLIFIPLLGLGERPS